MNLRPWSRDISSQTHYLLTGDEVREQVWEADQPYVLIARGDCFYQTLDLADVPVSARERYLDIQVQRLSPWPRPGYYAAATSGERVPVWMWDAEKEARLREKLPEHMRRARAMPESVFFEPRGAGPVVLACSHGLEYQHWEGGELLASRWSQTPLVDGNEQAFARDQGLEALPPEPGLDAPRLSSPWSEPGFSWQALLRNEAFLMLSITAALVFTVFLELGLLGATYLKTLASEQSAGQLQDQLGERLEYRLRAERLHEANESLAALLPAHTLLEVVAEFTRLLEDQDYELLEWDYASGGLRVVLKNAALDGREVIRRLESGGFFTRARITPTSREGEYEIELAIAGDAP